MPSLESKDLVWSVKCCSKFRLYAVAFFDLVEVDMGCVEGALADLLLPLCTLCTDMFECSQHGRRCRRLGVLHQSGPPCLANRARPFASCSAVMFGLPGACGNSSNHSRFIDRISSPSGGPDSPHCDVLAFSEVGHSDERLSASTVANPRLPGIAAA